MECTICGKKVDKPIQMRGHMSGHARLGKKRPGVGGSKGRMSTQNIDEIRYWDNKGYVLLRKQQGHPLASLLGHVPEHRKNLYDTIGPGEHKCWWCGKTVVWAGDDKTRINVDHLDGVKHNNTPENLVPACMRCNRSGARLMQHKVEYEKISR
jgi:hypothetical protein